VTGASPIRNKAADLSTAVVVATLGSSSAWAFTYLVKYHVPELWLFWFASGAAIAGLLAVWRPRFWVVAAAATISPLLLQTMLAIRDAPPTASALAAAFATGWAALAVLGAFVGRLLASSSFSAARRTGPASGSS
jgi:hypothetical protein